MIRITLIRTLRTVRSQDVLVFVGRAGGLELMEDIHEIMLKDTTVSVAIICALSLAIVMAESGIQR